MICVLFKNNFQDIKEAKGATINLTNLITNSLGNVVNDVIFGFKYPPEDKTWQWFRKIQEEGCHEMGVAGVVNFLPFIRLVSILIIFMMAMCIRKNKGLRYYS